MIKQNRLKLSLSTLISLIIVSTAVIMVATLLAVMTHESRSAALESAEAIFDEISAKTIAKMNVIMTSVSALTDTAALTFREARIPAGEEDFLHHVTPMKSMLESNPLLMSVYIGYTNGAFHQFITSRGIALILKTYQAPPGTAYIDRTITTGQNGEHYQIWRFLDDSLVELGRRRDATVSYDPRVRP
jgi:hypothetical protein